jgi:hypothetical protein
MVVDMSIADVIILIVISLGIYHFLIKRKVPKDGRSNEKKQVPGVEKDIEQLLQPDNSFCHTFCSRYARQKVRQSLRAGITG